MILLDLISVVEDYCGFTPVTTSSTNGDNRDRAVRYINEAIEAIFRVAEDHEFSWTSRSFYLLTTAERSTGTISVTNGSDSATLSTAITYNPTNCRLLVGSDTQPFIITAYTVGSTTTALTIMPPYTGTTDTDATFKIYQDCFILPKRLKAIVSPLWGQDEYQPISPNPKGGWSGRFRKNTQTGNEILFRAAEPSVSAWYTSPGGTTGAGLTAGSATVTLAGISPTTEWVGRYIVFNGESKEYEIKAKPSSTTITLGSKYSGTQGSAVAFEIDPRPSPRIQVTYYPDDVRVINAEVYVWPVKYEHNNDVIEIPETMRNCILEGAKWRYHVDFKEWDAIDKAYVRFMTEVKKQVVLDSRTIGEHTELRMGDWTTTQQSGPRAVLYFDKVVEGS